MLALLCMYICELVVFGLVFFCMYESQLFLQIFYLFCANRSVLISIRAVVVIRHIWHQFNALGDFCWIPNLFLYESLWFALLPEYIYCD